MRESDPLPKLTALGAPNMTKREAVGLLVDAPSDYNVRFDKRKTPGRARDFGSIGEDADGIWVRRHPEVLLMHGSPELLEVYDEFLAGQVQVTREDFDTLAAPAYDAKVTMADTLSRMGATDAR